MENVDGHQTEDDFPLLRYVYTDLIISVSTGPRSVFGGNNLAAAKQKEIMAVVSMIQQWTCLLTFSEMVTEVNMASLVYCIALCFGKDLCTLQTGLRGMETAESQATFGQRGTRYSDWQDFAMSRICIEGQNGPLDHRKPLRPYIGGFQRSP